MIKFAQLDPRPTPEAKASNDAIFNSGPVLGIEVTIPALAQRCSLGNIDHHDEYDYQASAIDLACNWPIAGFPELPENFTIAILKPDCDSIGAAAVISHRFDSEPNPDHSICGLDEEKIRIISETDRFQKGEIWHPQTLPTRENPWPNTGSLESSRELAPVHAMCCDHAIPLLIRVGWMLNWLRGGDLFCAPGTIPYADRVEKERQNLISALESGQIKYRLDLGGITVITTTHRAATMVGYCLAPVVIAINPEFRFRPDMEPVRKVTICAWSNRYADIPACLKELNMIEPGWGGAGNIGGSPQGISCTVETQKIIDIVLKHI